MASIFRRTYRQKLASGKTVTRKCKHYTIHYRDDGGSLQRVKGYVDLAATRQKAAELERALARGEQGLVDHFKASKARPILEHVKEYIADLKAAGRSNDYAYNARRRLERLIEGTGWATLAEVEPNGFVRWRETEKASDERRQGKSKTDRVSAQTLNQYLDTARAFLNWCAQMKRVTGVPIGRKIVSLALAGIADVDGPKVRKRRALTDEQVQALLAAATVERRIIYRTALAVGLRRSELEDLIWGDLRLTAITPYVQLRAEATKAGRADRLDLPQSLAADLRKLRPEGAKDNGKVFGGVPDIDTWREDLAAAGIPWKDDMGRQADFHGGTRKTMCSRMHRAGVPLAVAMRRMRHTDARLTMVDYVDDEQIGMAAGVLPELEAMATTAAPAQAVAGA
jgi:integrase